ncbi:SET domain-containing protein [Aspergillus candidus]|uniref:SET domain-containing protein n=1 Tax=Aspergillus candidus TaxID=41067 RepID=A0A2I2EZD7_ASPCN|nr:SET domain-containing protein [Aspergillus candidus]PLB33745.1 SET domain-containing protein [Aspergillus candidus]
MSIDTEPEICVSLTAGTDTTRDNEESTRPSGETRSIRQVHSDSRFPLRKPRQEPVVPVMTPTSTDKLLSGIWRQIHSEVKWGQPNLLVDPDTYIGGGMSKEAFRLVNTICLTCHGQSQSSRALEMIVQAYWVDCFEARIVAFQIEQPLLSVTEARMTVLREACAVLRLTEKELRNRLGIWRGYKEIKEAGGWASLVFAGSGIYRFCKYRIGFNEGLTTQLRHLRQSFEVAADTLHPQWRQLLGIVGQASPPRYTGHPHQWVIVDSHPAQPLKSTYRHLGVEELDYQFIDKSVIDQDVFGSRDPRLMPQINPDICSTCAERQSDNITLNRCSCFPDLFGCLRLPTAVQVVGTQNGKNNGVVARRDFERGAAIGEFIGLITNGVEGRDVMIGGSESHRYQIFQGQMGNFTRFINHSCNPNSQFQRFCWRGSERIVVVSRGVLSGSEITVDYSDHYWSCLDKVCLCGELCCRFLGKRAGSFEC